MSITKRIGVPMRVLPELSEKQWQAQLLELAERLGWSWYHTHDSRRSVAGFPDLVLTRERVVFVELKAEHGRVRAEQTRWKLLLEVAGAEVYLWRPSDLDEAVRVLCR